MCQYQIVSTLCVGVCVCACACPLPRRPLTTPSSTGQPCANFLLRGPSIPPIGRHRQTPETVICFAIPGNCHANALHYCHTSHVCPLAVVTNCAVYIEAVAMRSSSELRLSVDRYTKCRRQCILNGQGVQKNGNVECVLEKFQKMKQCSR